MVSSDGCHDSMRLMIEDANRRNGRWHDRPRSVNSSPPSPPSNADGKFAQALLVVRRPLNCVTRSRGNAAARRSSLAGSCHRSENRRHILLDVQQMLPHRVFLVTRHGAQQSVLPVVHGKFSSSGGRNRQALECLHHIARTRLHPADLSIRAWFRRREAERTFDFSPVLAFPITILPKSHQRHRTADVSSHT